MWKVWVVFLWMGCLLCGKGYAAQDTLVIKDSNFKDTNRALPKATTENPVVKKPTYTSLNVLLRDSVRFVRALEKQRIKDSLARVADSLKVVREELRMQYLRPLGPHAPNQFLDSLKKEYIITQGNALLWRKGEVNPGHRDVGERESFRPSWIIWTVFFLFFFFGLIRLFFTKDLEAIATSFYSNRVLLQISKEDNLVTSWPFVFLYLLFGCTIGLFLYLYISYEQSYGGYPPISLFFTIAGTVLLLFVLKIVITRSIGFVFGLQKLVRDYVSIVYLSYFNAAILFLPLLLVLSLIPVGYVSVWIFISCLLSLLVFGMQFLRASNTVLKSYQFSKFYLFIYLCTLEVGPILILIKLLGI